VKLLAALIACLVCLHLAAPSSAGEEIRLRPQVDAQETGFDTAIAVNSASDAAHFKGGKVAPACGDHCHATAQSFDPSVGDMAAAPAMSSMHTFRPTPVRLLVPPPQ